MKTRKKRKNRTRRSAWMRSMGNTNEGGQLMTPAELKSALESIIYAADEPATVEQLANAVGEEKHLVRAALDELVASFASDERGVEIRSVAGGFRVYTKPQHHDVVRRFIKS